MAAVADIVFPVTWYTVLEMRVDNVPDVFCGYKEKNRRCSGLRQDQQTRLFDAAIGNPDKQEVQINDLQVLIDAAAAKAGRAESMDSRSSAQ